MNVRFQNLETQYMTRDIQIYIKGELLLQVFNLCISYMSSTHPRLINVKLKGSSSYSLCSDSGNLFYWFRTLLL